MVAMGGAADAIANESRPTGHDDIAIALGNAGWTAADDEGWRVRNRAVDAEFVLREVVLGRGEMETDALTRVGCGGVEVAGEVPDVDGVDGVVVGRLLARDGE